MTKTAMVAVCLAIAAFRSDPFLWPSIDPGESRTFPQYDGRTLRIESDRRDNNAFAHYDLIVQEDDSRTSKIRLFDEAIYGLQFLWQRRANDLYLFAFNCDMANAMTVVRVRGGLCQKILEDRGNFHFTVHASGDVSHPGSAWHGRPPTRYSLKPSGYLALPERV